MRNTSLLKPLFTLICISILFASCKSASGINSNTRNRNHLAEEIIHSASENIGVPYKYAGTTKAGFDCSGLVFTTFNQFDIKLPRSSYEQAKIGTDLGKNVSKAQKGDLIFFKTNNRNRINHVGIIVDTKDDELQFIHASTSRGVIISSTKEAYYEKAFAQLNRILP